MRQARTLWTFDESAAAVAEGWDLFNLGAARPELQADSDSDIFAEGGDDDVHAHVVARALDGSPLHVKALAMLWLEDQRLSNEVGMPFTSEDWLLCELDEIKRHAGPESWDKLLTIVAQYVAALPPDDAPIAEQDDEHDYRVTWEITIQATSPKDAARQALAIQRDPTSTSTVFVVARTEGPITTIDLIQSE